MYAKISQMVVALFFVYLALFYRASKRMVSIHMLTSSCIEQLWHNVKIK